MTKINGIAVGKRVPPYKVKFCVCSYLELIIVALVHERTVPKKLPPPVGEVSANFYG
jgi:hypothetical protein